MKLKIILPLLVLIVGLASCKKDDPEVITNTVNVPVTPTPTIVGLWKGKYGNGAGVYPSSGYAFLYRADGTVRVFNNTDTTIAAKGEGTYLKSGSIVTCTYTYVTGGTGTFSTSATIDANMTFLEGTWGSGTNTTNGGLYFVNKQ